MNEHILLKNAKRYPLPSKVEAPINCDFKYTAGYWEDRTVGRAMMLSDNPKKPQSKKFDIETGEDQKGE